MAPEHRSGEQAATRSTPVDGDAHIDGGGIDDACMGLETRPGGAQRMGNLGLLVGDMPAAGKLQQGFELAGLPAVHAFDFISFEQIEAAGIGAARVLAPQTAVDPAADQRLGFGL
jgi:spore coat protein CotH